MVLTLILVLAAVVLFLVLRDDHDDSYNRSEKPKAAPKQAVKPVAPVRPAPSKPRTIVPEEKQYRPRNQEDRFRTASRAVDFRFLDGAYYDHSLADRIMSSFIANFHENVQPDDLAGVVGFVHEDRSKGSLEVCTPEGRLLGYLPARGRVPFHAINPQGLPCPFAGHVGISTTGTYYADIRIAVPCSREFVEQTLREFLSEP